MKKSTRWDDFILKQKRHYFVNENIRTVLEDFFDYLSEGGKLKSCKTHLTVWIGDAMCEKCYEKGLKK